MKRSTIDPQKLLSKIVFPNDRLEDAIKHSRSARWNAIYRLQLDDLDTDWHSFKQKLLNDQSAAEERRFQIKRINLSKFAAAVVIQSVYRSWVIRKKYTLVVSFRISQLAKIDHKPALELPQLILDAQELLLKRYNNYLKLEEKKDRIPTFPCFCSAYIAAIYKGFRARQLYKKYQQEKNNLDANAIQWIRQKIQEQTFRHVGRSEAAKIIQRAWLRFYNRRMYRFYRDLIRYREQADPKSLLRFINPREATLIEKAMGIHVRFRLGGSDFPPTIYYKIYVDRNLIDMNSFSPRNYTDLENKQLLPRQLFNKNSEPGNSKVDGWYNRFENNDWRPVLDDMFDLKADVVTSNRQTRRFHYSFEKRHEKVQTRTLAKQKIWLDKITQCVENLDEIQWAKNLDFDSYQKQWSLLATTSQFDTLAQ